MICFGSPGLHMCSRRCSPRELVLSWPLKEPEIKSDPVPFLHPLLPKSPGFYSHSEELLSQADWTQTNYLEMTVKLVRGTGSIAGLVPKHQHHGFCFVFCFFDLKARNWSQVVSERLYRCTGQEAAVFSGKGTGFAAALTWVRICPLLPFTCMNLSRLLYFSDLSLLFCKMSLIIMILLIARSNGAFTMCHALPWVLYMHCLIKFS